jgi:hypothetical protein
MCALGYAKNAESKPRGSDAKKRELISVPQCQSLLGFVHIDNAELQTNWLFTVLMNLYLHRWIIGRDSSRYKFSMIEIKDQTLVALK